MILGVQMVLQNKPQFLWRQQLHNARDFVNQLPSGWFPGSERKTGTVHESHKSFLSKAK